MPETHGEVLAPYRIQVQCPPHAVPWARRQLLAVLEDTALDTWFTIPEPISGPSWGLWWDDTLIWSGVQPDPMAWAEALLEGWWGVGGGCC
jgi:hypothetical protein